MKYNDFLRNLSSERRPDADVFKKPQYAGIMNIVTELYPDNAHFIYELLQNAEDAQATEITFRLELRTLVVEHNGTRLFSEKDVESITSIGNTTKRDDITQIGKFGVGFKAVFSYTNTPKVHSGGFSFEIQDLIVPEPITPINKQTNTTIFEFPFNNPKKLAQLAEQEIEKGLCALGDNTLLFLSHIRKINYTLPDGSNGSLQRINHENGRIEIRSQHPHGEASCSHWLHFQKDEQVEDDKGNPKTCRVAIAYQLEQETSKNKDPSTWKVVAVQGGGQVSIYFPAEKETSKLRFHLHAPFASTVARDSVRDCPANILLRDHLAELIVDSFTAIRDQDMLSMSFLAVLPNPKDNLSEFYEPIREVIVDAFTNQPLTPTKSGSYVASGKLYRGSSKISDVIGDEDLLILTGYEIPLWAANAPQRNQREDNFLDSLEIDKWDFEELSDIFKPARKEKTESWLATKDDKWMVRFYTLLNDDNNTYYRASAERFPLVRVDSEGSVKHVTGNQAHFAPLHGNVSTQGVSIVKRSVYTKNNTKHDIDENVEKFLQSIGVKPFDTKAVIKLRLKLYQSSPPKQITNQYYEDIKQFISYWKENAKEGSWLRRETDDLFKPVDFLLDANLYWRKIIDICLDSPVTETETGLAELAEIHGKNPIWSEYSKKLNEDERRDFVEFLKALGAMFKLEVVELERHDATDNPNNPYNNNPKWGRASYALDYSIPDLGKYLIAKKVTASLIIWNTIINTHKDHAYAKFALTFKNGQPIKLVDSRLVYLLKKYAWIPNKSGEFLTPQAITRETLHPDFPFNDSNKLLTAIEFGKEEKDQAETLRRQTEQASSVYQTKANIAKNSGFDSPEEMDESAKLAKLAKEKGKSFDDIRLFLSPQNSPDFSDDTSINPNRRGEKIKEAANDDPERRTEIRERSVAVDTSEIKIAAKEYLKDRYIKDNVLYCQICKQPMPFKLTDGSYYFEAVELLKNGHKRHKQNFIALCPTDAAKFLYANESKETINESINALTARTQEEINNSQDEGNICLVNLAGNPETLTFSPIHLLDLKVIG